VLAIRPVSLSFSVVVILFHFIMLADKFYNNNNGRNVVSRKMSTCVGQYEPIERFVWETKFTFFSPNMEGVVVDQAVFRFAMCRSVPQIFAIKVESCQKSRRFPDVFFAVPKFRGWPSKSYTHFVTPASRHVAWKKVYEDTPTSPEIIGAHALNFKPHFKFPRLNFSWGTLSQLLCALARLG